jgi:hypothetical protein
MRPERRVLAKLVAWSAGACHGLFELADGRRVEIEGVVDLDSLEAPSPGEKVFIIIDECGRPVRWEPYVGARLRRGLD